eukprot:scaffold90142_cov18-Tisochrysis_lutea.AAC.1
MPVCACNNPLQDCNLERTVSLGSASRPVLGFLRPGSQTEVLPITKCWLQDDTANTILEGVRREALEERRLLPYNDPSGKCPVKHLSSEVPRALYLWPVPYCPVPYCPGFLKHLVIRSSRPAPPSSAAPSDTPGANLHHHHHQQQQQQQQKVKPGGLSYESGPGSSQQEKEYLVTFVVTSRDAVAALQPVADSLVASIPQEKWTTFNKLNASLQLSLIRLQTAGVPMP